MSFIKETHMSRFKAGKIKDKEQLVICKLRQIGDRPEIHVFTDGSSKASSIIRVKRFAAVLETDDVPKIVKAKYENYIYITGSGGKTTYLNADSRQQRDEWCDLLRDLLPSKATAGAQGIPPPQPHRERTQTDASSNKPPVSRRRVNAPQTAPGSMQGIFRDELSNILKKRTPRDEPIPEIDEGNVCCDLHHVELGTSHGAQCFEEDPNLYQNVHSVTNMDNWRKEQSSRTALRQTRKLYNDFHQTRILQKQSEDDYVTPEQCRDQLPELLNHLSGCSITSGDSENGASAMSVPHSLQSSKEPTESSWPSSPEHSAEESEPEYPHPTERALPELPGRGLPELSRRGLPELARRELPELPASGRLLEPEASLCLDEQPEDIYVNTPKLFSRYGSNSPLPRAVSLRTETKPQLPPRKSSLPTVTQGPVPPELPVKNPPSTLEDLCRILKEEKLSETVRVIVSKTTLSRNLLGLSLETINDCIIVTKLPDKLKNYFRVGDQWLMVNDSYLNGVQFAKDCVEMSDKKEIEITLRRIPFGTICEFPWSSHNIEDIGISLVGNEIERVYPSGLAHRRGSLQSNDTNSLTSAGLKCNQVITELNFEPVDPNVTDEELWEMIKCAGRHIVLILHPVDFRTIQRGYKLDDDCIYENV